MDAFFLQSSGRIFAEYKATKPVTDTITISGTGVWPEGATTDSFDVVNCAYEVSIGASYYVEDSRGKIDTELHGKAWPHVCAGKGTCPRYAVRSLKIQPGRQSKALIK
jgi:hypothetical protein